MVNEDRKFVSDVYCEDGIIKWEVKHDLLMIVYNWFVGKLLRILPIFLRILV